MRPRLLSTLARAPVVAAAALLVALAGCGHGKPGATDGVRAAVQTFTQNCAEGEGVAASEGLTEPTREEFLAEAGVFAGCRRVLGLGSGAPGFAAPDALRSARVSGADAHGGIGSAIVELPGGVRRRVEAERVEGRWLLALPSVEP